MVVVLDYCHSGKCYSLRDYHRWNGCYHLVRDCYCLNACVEH